MQEVDTREFTMTIHESYYTNEFQIATDFYKESEAEAQVDFVEKSALLRQEDAILDLACGYGRHAIALANRGYRVTGFDQSADYIEQARINAQKQAAAVTFEIFDMRGLSIVEAFDVVLSMSSSLAFYDDMTNIDIFGRIRRALKPGGCFFFDQANIFWLSEFFGAGKRNDTKELEDGRLHHRTTTFNASSCVLTRRSVLESGSERKESGWDLRYYTLPELKQIMPTVQLDLSSVYGDYDASAYTVESKRLITLWKAL